MAPEFTACPDATSVVAFNVENRTELGTPAPAFCAINVANNGPDIANP